MPNNFLGDLSEGIFERLGGLRREQESKDESQKLQTLQLLTSLTDQVEPESKSVLMRHIGDVIGIKGKMKGFWNAFSGMPDRSVEDQLGTKLKEISSGTVGSQTAQKAREGGDLARLFQPMNPTQEANRNNRLQAEQDLQGKMIFRDPRAEKLEDLRTQYGAKFAQQDSVLQERERLLRERGEQQASTSLQNRLTVEKEKADLQSEKDIRKAAILYARGQGRGYLTEADWSKAVKDVSRRTGLDEQLLRGRVGLTGALEEKARTEASTLKAGGGLTPSQDLSKRRFTADQEKELRGLESDVSKSEAAFNDLTPKIQEIEKSLDATAKRFNKTRQDLLSSDAYSITGPMGPIGKIVKDYRELLKQKSAAEAEMNTKRKQMDEFKTKFKGAIPPQKPTGPGPRAGIGTTSGRINIPVLDPMKYEVGGRIKYRGRWHKIMGLSSDSVIAVPE